MRYVRAVDGRARAQLVERNIDLARRAAAMIHPRVRDHVPFDDLMAFASAGLAEAASRYDPAHGVTFPAYAWYRVTGSIIDGLRRATLLPRRTWSKLVALRAAHEYLENRAERERGATLRGAQPATGADALAQVQQAMSAIRTIYMTSLEAKRDQGFDAAGEPPALADRIDLARMVVRLQKALARLPDKERALMAKYYWEGKNLEEVGTELGISKSWASRLHAQVVEKLRAIIDASLEAGV